MKKIHVIISILGMALSAYSVSTMAAGKGKDAYFVKVDSETTTENSTDKPGKKVKKARVIKKKPRPKTAAGHASGKRQHKPVVVRKKKTKKKVTKVKKRAKKKSSARKIPGLHKSGDVTLKRGVIK